MGNEGGFETRPYKNHDHKRCHLFLNAGGRFAMKAAMPSF
jgi:hypothetical protein